MITNSGAKNRSKRALPLLLLIIALAVSCFSGCVSVPETGPTDPAASETDSAAPSVTPLYTADPSTEAPKTDIPETDIPATAEITPVPTPVFPANENDIGTENASALEYISAIADPEKVLLNEKQISEENARMVRDCPMVVNILDIPEKISGESLSAALNPQDIPSLPLFDQKGNSISESDIDGILAQIPNEPTENEIKVVPGIVVKRGDLKRLPTALEFHSFAGSNVDLIQDTELYIGMPVWVMGQTDDGKFMYVQSYYYGGWTLAENIALAGSVEEWLRFADPSEFVVVIDAKLDISGEQADMGVKLPYIDIDPAGEYYIAERPVRNEDGSLGAEQVTLSVRSSHRGYLNYTYANFLIQAFKYEGTMYAWGGLNGGIDCSSYIASVMRSFGFYLPRDTKDQNYSAGTNIDISGMSADQIRQAVVTAGAGAPVAIYLKGHVRFYIGEKDGTFMTIHAPGSKKPVAAEQFDKFDGIISVRVFCG